MMNNNKMSKMDEMMSKMSESEKMAMREKMMNMCMCHDCSTMKDCSTNMNCKMPSENGVFCGMSGMPMSENMKMSDIPMSESMKCMCTSCKVSSDNGMSMNFPCMPEK